MNYVRNHVNVSVMSDIGPLDLPLGEIEIENAPWISATVEDTTEPVTDVPVSDNIEDGGVFDGATTPVGDGACSVCGAPVFRPPGLTPTGRRKRVPKYCDLHNPKVRVGPVFDDGFTRANVDSQLRRIQEELADDVRLLGTLAGPMFPVTGYYIFDGADSFTLALLKLCKNNSRMLRVLHRAAQVAPVYEVAKFGAGIGIAVQVDNKKHDPHSGAARRLGVEYAYSQVYPSDTPQYPSNNNGYTPPPKYATVQ